MCGSSPLARGTRANTRAKPGSSSVHPHSRGEHLLIERIVIVNGGSSPLARGTLNAYGSADIHPRFIPTRAGNTCATNTTHPPSAVHPHSRGEHLLITSCARSCPGSSPLARGTRRTHRHLPPGRRFIPTRAGNTPYRVQSARASAVHPHSRGEHGSQPRVLVAEGGSSPLARGTRVFTLDHPVINRFIPTRAGNTNYANPHNCLCPVHPHSRGEHIWPSDDHDQCAGSSPLARGTRDPLRRNDLQVRFIPTRAGNTRSRRLARTRSTVHPHSRGEHAMNPKHRQIVDGSSPLARGTRGSSRRDT